MPSYVGRFWVHTEDGVELTPELKKHLAELVILDMDVEKVGTAGVISVQMDFNSLTEEKGEGNE